jgi:hypothetical protein
MEKKIEKPVTVVRQEFIDTIFNTINKCGLPPFVIEPILKDLYLEVKSLSQRQYEMDRDEYESKLKIGDGDESK